MYKSLGLGGSPKVFKQFCCFIPIRLNYVYLIPRRETNIGLKSLSYTGPSLWNNLNKNLKRSSSINDFKHKIKEFYFEELKKKHES